MTTARRAPLTPHQAVALVLSLVALGGAALVAGGSGTRVEAGDPVASSGASTAGLGGTVTLPDAATAATRATTTVSGTGPWAGLKVSVSQTANLVDQTVDITWTGGRPTHDASAFDADFLQLMQCWSKDAATRPDRTQCQFGGTVGFDGRGGENTNSRQLNQATYADPKEPLVRGLTLGQQAFVPFVAADGTSVKGAAVLKNPFYDSTTTNEVAYARTRGTGTGAVQMEVQTARESPGLGCGDVTTVPAVVDPVTKKVTTPARTFRPACWLVVVPRGDSEVDGSPLATVVARGSHRLDSSPLSTTNWAARITIPLTFAPIGQVCPLSGVTVDTEGTETIGEAIGRWQPVLCRNRGPVFAYSQIGDSVVANDVAQNGASLYFVNAPVPHSAVPADTSLIYAPVALSGLAIGVLVERRTPPDAPAAQKADDGALVTSVRLTPRLVAKELTASYGLGVGLGATYLRANPANMSLDPEFLRLNPQFVGQAHADTALDVLVPITSAAAFRQLWAWIEADDEARDFVAGRPDPFGMRVNPFTQGLNLDRDDFPKSDPFCDPNVPTGATPLCFLDRHPYTTDLHEAARSAARGDVLARANWDPTAQPPAWKKLPLQLVGQRAGLALTDTPTAARYGLVPAALRNASGRFVTPTPASMLAGVTAMGRDDPVDAMLLDLDPGRATGGAYPLTVITYAAATASRLSVTEARRAADFIRFAAGRGQTPGTAAGTLPAGYVPLPSNLRREAVVNAGAIQDREGGRAPSAGPPGGSKSGSTGGTKGGTTGGTGGSTRGSAGRSIHRSGSTGPTRSTGGPGTSTRVGGPSAPAQGPAPAAQPPAASSPVAAATTPAVTTTAARTPAERPGSGRWVLVVALVLGVGAVLLGPSLPRLARRLGA